MTESKPLSYYQNQVDAVQCPDCGGQLQEVEGYPHTGGWLIDGQPTRQWLSTRCRKCRYDWSLWKLGIYGDIMHPQEPAPHPDADELRENQRLV